jgi:hypothetical protein
MIFKLCESEKSNAGGKNQTDSEIMFYFNYLGATVLGTVL